MNNNLINFLLKVGCVLISSIFFYYFVKNPERSEFFFLTCCFSTWVFISNNMSAYIRKRDKILFNWLVKKKRVLALLYAWLKTILFIFFVFLMGYTLGFWSEAIFTYSNNSFFILGIFFFYLTILIITNQNSDIFIRRRSHRKIVFLDEILKIILASPLIVLLSIITIKFIIT